MNKTHLKPETRIGLNPKKFGYIRIYRIEFLNYDYIPIWKYPFEVLKIKRRDKKRIKEFEKCIINSFKNE